VLNFGGRVFLSDVLVYTEALHGTTVGSRTVITEADPISSLQSFFGRVTANLNDRFLLTGTLRADGSSKFGTNNQYGIFPSFAAAWNLHNEDFFANAGIFDQLKLRVGWGQTGNQEFDAGASQRTFELQQNLGVRAENLANPDLKWETSSTWNIGVDFAVFGAALTGSVEYFNKVTTDILFNLTLASPAPDARIWQNLDGEIVNSGVEVALDWLAMSRDNVNLNIGANVSFLSNELRDYTGPDVLTGNLHGQGITNTTVQLITNNQPLNVFQTRRFTGLDETGFNTFEDGGALFFTGDPNPDILLGLNANLSINKFDVIMNFAGAFGQQVYNNTLNSVIPIGNLGSRNVAADLIGGPVREDLGNPISASSRYIEDGDYLKMTNFQIAYNVGTYGAFKNIRVAITGQNLFVLTSFSGFDPEVNTDKERDGFPSFGIEFTPYPTPRTFTFNVNFSL
jgi:iron complex outermembrane receptor protein